MTIWGFHEEPITKTEFSGFFYAVAYFRNVGGRPFRKFFYAFLLKKNNLLRQKFYEKRVFKGYER